MRVQGDYGDLVIPTDHAAIRDIVKAAVRDTVNGQIRGVERAVDRLASEQREMRRETNQAVEQLRTELGAITERAERWDHSADATERAEQVARGVRRLITDKRVLAIALILAAGADAAARLGIRVPIP